MRTFKFTLLLFPLLILSCTSDVVIENPDFFPGNFPINNCLDGVGSMVSESRDMPDFHSVLNTIYADILITQGPKEDIIIEAQPNILMELKTEVVNGELILEFDRCVNITKAIKVHITIPDIQALSLTGVGNFVAQNQLDLTELNITLTGVGDFLLAGNAATLNILLTGVGDVNAFDFEVGNCDVTITGTGDVEVFVNDELNVNITGVGTVFFKGNPMVNSIITGAGSVVDAN